MTMRQFDLAFNLGICDGATTPEVIAADNAVRALVPSLQERFGAARHESDAVKVALVMAVMAEALAGGRD